MASKPGGLALSINDKFDSGSGEIEGNDHERIGRSLYRSTVEMMDDEAEEVPEGEEEEYPEPEEGFYDETYECYDDDEHLRDNDGLDDYQFSQMTYDSDRRPPYLIVSD